jgi:hypothetical protein
MVWGGAPKGKVWYNRAMSTADRIQTYQQFWPFYLGEHQKPATRWLHFVGTHVGLGCLVLGLVTPNRYWIAGWPIASYAFAWVAHFFVEKNRPATFTYPFWSLISDYRMVAYMWLGRIGSELSRHRSASAA